MIGDFPLEDIKEVNKRLCKWCEDNMEIKLPRWEDLPELEDIITIVYELARQQDNFVSIHNGNVYTTKYGEGNTYLRTYDSTLGKVGDQHIAFLCMECIKDTLGHLGIKVWLMDRGVAWEWPK